MISLKTYSFIRENAYKVMYPWHKDAEYGPAVWYGGQMSPQVGSLHHYLYFLIMPTLLYRDHYPLWALFSMCSKLANFILQEQRFY